MFNWFAKKPTEKLSLISNRQKIQNVKDKKASAKQKKAIVPALTFSERFGKFIKSRHDGCPTLVRPRKCFDNKIVVKKEEVPSEYPPMCYSAEDWVCRKCNRVFLGIQLKKDETKRAVARIRASEERASAALAEAESIYNKAVGAVPEIPLAVGETDSVLICALCRESDGDMYKCDMCGVSTHLSCNHEMGGDKCPTMGCGYSFV